MSSMEKISRTQKEKGNAFITLRRGKMTFTRCDLDLGSRSGLFGYLKGIKILYFEKLKPSKNTIGTSYNILKNVKKT